MNNKTHLVAFIDILGFKNLIDDHFSYKDKHSLSFLKTALKEAKDFAIVYSKQYLKQFQIKFSFRQFSDCVCISMPFKQGYYHTTLTIYGAFINVIRMYQLILLYNNILIRGGIAIGGHFENANMIFSEGLVKAYKIENQKAIYPRIIIDNGILHLIEGILKEVPNQFDEFYELFGHSVIKDWDDEVFVSPFGMMGELKSIGNRYGEEILKSIWQLYVESNKLDDELLENLLEELETSDTDKSMIKPMLDSVNKFLLDKPNEKNEVLLKYKWLRQFMTWNVTPRKAQIKFEHYFKN